jgi:hypothetical protein
MSIEKKSPLFVEYAKHIFQSDIADDDEYLSWKLIFIHEKSLFVLHSYVDGECMTRNGLRLCKDNAKRIFVFMGTFLRLAKTTLRRVNGQNFVGFRYVF